MTIPVWLVVVLAILAVLGIVGVLVAIQIFRVWMGYNN